MEVISLSIPKEPVILLSYINTQLRDYFGSLDDLCLSLDIKKDDLLEKLSTIDYFYDETLNKFI